MSSRDDRRAEARPVVPLVLAVEDEEAIRRVIERALIQAGYDCVGAGTLAEARAALVEHRPDLILCDINLGPESGVDLVRQVSRELPDTAVVMVTGVDDRTVADDTLALGAYGYLVKPFTPNQLVIQVDGALRRRALERARRFHLEELEAKVLDRSAALRSAFDRAAEAEQQAGSVHREMADRLALALTLRDEETGGHVERVGRYVALLAELAGVTAWDPYDLRTAGMLHDVGKIAVPDLVLLKPGPLTAEEFDLVRRHPEAGRRLLAGASSVALRLGASIAMTHHERWDGAGYPIGLVGEEIPVEGRLTAIVDCFDALTSDRPYRRAMSPAEALATMEKDAGHFDPDLFARFVAEIEQFVAITAEVPDDPEKESTIRIVVVDDHAMFAESLVRLLDRTTGMSVAGTASTVAEAVAACRAAAPDVVVADWSLPDGTGADVAAQVRADRPATQVVVLGDGPDDAALLAALDAGAAGCLGKHRAFDELTAAIRSAHAGRILVPPTQLHALLRRLRPKTPATPANLTAREYEVLGLMAEGLSTEAIAERLMLSLHTVRNHVQHVLEKLGAHSRLEAVATAVRTGLLKRS